MKQNATWTTTINPWLCQGDLFVPAPLVTTNATVSALASEVLSGPAMLVSHDCSLDKVNKRGEMQATQATFLPLRAVSLLEGNRATILRSNNLTPYDVLYVGTLPDVGEAYVSLAHASTVVLDYFAPELRDFPGEDEFHLVATHNDSRVGSLAADQLELLRSKWNAHWTRRVPPTVEGQP